MGKPVDISFPEDYSWVNCVCIRTVIITNSTGHTILFEEGKHYSFQGMFNYYWQFLCPSGWNMRFSSIGLGFGWYWKRVP